MSIRRLGILLAGTVFVMASVASGYQAVAAPGGGGCQLQGTANLSPPLSSSSGAFTYNFTGALSGCQSNISTAPTAGTVAAGVTFPETVTLTNTTTGAKSTGTVTYQEPVPTGTGSCGNSTTSGQALATWNNNKHTAFTYTTTGALAAVHLTGTVTSGITLTLVASSVPAGFSAPPTFTVPSDEPTFAAGQGALGALTFSPTTQDQDCVNKGVSSAAINGFIGIGSTS
jgi:hypothetical protein